MMGHRDLINKMEHVKGNSWFSIKRYLVHESFKNGYPFSVSDCRRIFYVFQGVEKVVKYIANQEISFSAVKGLAGIYCTVKSNAMGMTLRSLLGSDVDEIKHRFQNHQLNPFFRVFFGYYDLLYLQRAANSSQLFYDEALCLADKLNDFVDYIKREYATGEFKKQMGNFKRISEKNYHGLKEYIDGLFENYSKLLVLRVDLGYGKENDGKEADSEVLSYGKVKNDHTNFLRTIKRHLEKTLQKKGLVGYVWKLEFSPVKSWHYHMIFFLDGQTSREDVTIARLIGEYWEEVTGGKGVYYNCNARKKSYTTPGVGLIDHRNVELRNGLMQAARYLIKTDYYIQLVAPDKGRTFAKGQLPKSRKNQAGRRRQPVDEELAKTSTTA